MITLEHLAAGDTPSLKPRNDWPISAGPWEVQKNDYRFTSGRPVEFSTFKVLAADACKGSNSDELVNAHCEADARFIASCNSDTPLAEKAWEEYQYHCYRSLDLDFEITENQEENGEDPDEKTVSDYKDENARALYWLTWLDTGGFVNWAGKAK